MRDPKHVAQTWLSKAKDEQDCFDRFVFSWFAFNALYNEFLQQSERKAISDLVYSNSYRLNQNTIKRILEGSSAQYFKERIVRDCRGGARDTSEHAVKLKSNYYPITKLKSLLFILYQVRCNLFHGNKIYGRDSDNEVVNHAANTLVTIIEAYINET